MKWPKASLTDLATSCSRIDQAHDVTEIVKKIRRTPNFSEAKFSVKPKSGNNSIVVVAAAALRDSSFTNSEFFTVKTRGGNFDNVRKKDREWKLFGFEKKANLF